MSIKELLKLPAANLASITDAQWKVHLAPYLEAIRPETEKPAKSVRQGTPKFRGKSEIEKTMDLANKWAAKMGIKI